MMDCNMSVVLLTDNCRRIILTTRRSRLTLLFTSTFGLLARTINTLGHCFDSFHHFFQYWFLLEEDNLACSTLKGFFCDVQAFID